MTPKEKKELKESLVNKLLQEGDSKEVKDYFNSMTIEELKELVNYKLGEDIN